MADGPKTRGKTAKQTGRPATAGDAGLVRRRAAEPAAEEGRASIGYSQPRTYEELRAVLSSGTMHLPKRLRQVAIFLWQHPGEVALGTISQVAEKAGVQPSTLVRFAQVFGYSGFSDFQNLFKEHMKASWPDRTSSAPRRGERAPADRELSFLNGLITASEASLARVEERIDTRSFRGMIEMLARAELIYVIGSKRAFPVTTYISLTLSQQGVRNLLVDNVGSIAFDQIGCIGPRDAVLAVSFSPYNSITPELVAAARERKAKILSMTDSTFSPLVRLSDKWVEVVESDFAGFRSLAASLAVGMALVHGIVGLRSS